MHAAIRRGWGSDEGFIVERRDDRSMETGEARRVGRSLRSLIIASAYGVDLRREEGWW